MLPKDIKSDRKEELARQRYRETENIQHWLINFEGQGQDQSSQYIKPEVMMVSEFYT